jgi:hypothetical protein
MALRRQEIGPEAHRHYEADVSLAKESSSLVKAASEAEAAFRAAQASRAPIETLHKLAVSLDAALSAAVSAAFAAQRAEIGPRGYIDRIYRRKKMATPAVHALTAQAERLLTLRETHRLNDIPDVPLTPAV